MLQSAWNKFLEDFAKSPHYNGIMMSVLKQVKPGELTQEKLTLICDNSGTKIYLDKKRPLLEELISGSLGNKISVELVIDVKPVKKDEPLFAFQPSKEDVVVKSGLNIKYTFENYAVSGTNQVAFAAAQAVARNPGISYNPLFLYGGVGVGKTHLAQAVARQVLDDNPEKKVFFCPGDQFTNELIESIGQKTTPKFRRKYRFLDLIIVDDIQFIAGKQAVQEEFFHTFNTVVSAGGQIILTSDRPPHEIKNLEDRLRSRFSGGLIVDIQSPDFELRTAILLIKAKEKNIQIDMEAAKVIAETVPDSRALEGTLLTLYAKTLGNKDRIDLEVVESFYEEKTVTTIKKVDASDIVKTVCSFYNVKQSHIKSPVRSEDIALPRQIIMYLLRRELKMKFEEIAYMLKRKDHTTVMHGVEKINRLMMKDPLIRDEVDKIMQMVRAT
jgi:chromosomal replication initiator protein